MTLITKDNIQSFMEYYHYFHDSYISDVLFFYKECKVELYIDVFWSGEPTLKDNGTYETNKKKIKMVCNNIIQYKYKENYADYIDDAYLKFLTINKQEYICFATDPEEPLISVLAESIEYEEIN